MLTKIAALREKNCGSNVQKGGLRGLIPFPPKFREIIKYVFIE
jgi:hypothetical protein